MSKISNITKKFQSETVVAGIILLAFGGLLSGLFFNEEKEKPAEGRIQREMIHTEKDFSQITRFELEIKKLGITVPIVPNVDGGDEETYDRMLEEGVAHFAGSALPDSGSNTFIFGHSSTALGSGKYDKAFADLGTLKEGDEITIFYNQKTLNYAVSESKIIAKEETSVIGTSEKEQLTLMTCWPIGTDDKRLIVIAKRLW